MTDYTPGQFQATPLQRVYWKNAAEALGEEVEKQGSQRVFLIVSSTLQKNTDEIKKCEEKLGSKHAGTWSGMGAHSPRKDVLSAADAARAANADLLVSIGGGSVTDGTKAVNMCIEKNVKSVDDFDALVGKSFFGPPEWEHTGKAPKQIAIPTTLSAGEFTPIAGVTDTRNPDKSHKELFCHPLHMQPVCVIFDPALSVHTPEWLWLSTGIRSVDHCTEAICSINGHHLSTAVASSALSLLAKALPKTKANKNDLDARVQCQIGCWQAITTLTMGVHYGGSHAIGHILGGTADVPHGYTSCINLPYVLEYNKVEIPDKVATVANALGSDKSGDVAMDALIRGLGMPRTLGDVDFPMDKLDLCAEYSMKDPWTATNPRPLKTPADVKIILDMAKNGTPNKANMVPQS